MFALKVILMVALVNLTTAWIFPERCQVYGGFYRTITEPIKAQITTNLTEAIIKYNEEIKSLYKDFKFYNMPSGGSYDEKTGHIKVFSTKNCEFQTDYFDLSHKPCLYKKSTQRCEVFEAEYYDTAKGHRWGAKASNKSSFITIGGEATTDDKYTCYHNKNGTTHRIVDYSIPAGQILYIHVFVPRMYCDIGETDLEPALRDNKTYVTAPENHFTKSERDELLAAASITYLVDVPKIFHMDTDKISGGLFDKLMTIFPNYDFSTDTISIKNNIVDVNYYQATKFQSSSKEKYWIPFTDSNGDGIYKYVYHL